MIVGQFANGGVRARCCCCCCCCADDSGRVEDSDEDDEEVDAMRSEGKRQPV